jgi:DNA polymerase III epsilon subunit family exonuclease
MAEPGIAYEQLRQRAYRFVQQRGGLVAEPVLIRHVFGSAGNERLWAPLLRQVLAGDERFVLRPDGCWALRTGGPSERLMPFPLDFVALDVETTGLRPARHRVIEFGAVRYREGRPVERIVTLLNPERRLPAYIAQLTGIREAMLLTAPTFGQVAEQILAFLGDDLLLGYNLGFDLDFLNMELRRIGRAPLVNEALDVLPLVRGLLPELGRLTLEVVCRALGVPQATRHRALADAEATGQLFLALSARARDAGLRSLDELRPAATSVPAAVEAVARGRAVLDRAHLDRMPERPGVYLMTDAQGRVLYVGKAKNLRRRVASYYSQPLGYTRRMDGLLESIAQIEVIETGSELEALLLESQFIHRYRPPYNSQQRNHESYPYIKVELSNPWPRFMLTRLRADDDACYLGPFRSTAAARAAIDLIHEVFPLRTCSRSFRTAKSYGSPCLQLALGRCLGPCTGRADPDRYRQMVRQALTFLRGERDDLTPVLHQQLAAAAERLDFERAARLRDLIRKTQTLLLSERLVDETLSRGPVVVVTGSSEPGAREFLLILAGRLWAQIRASTGECDDEIARRLEVAWERAAAAGPLTVDQESLDQVAIIGRWLRQHARHPSVFPLSLPPCWLEIVRRGRSLPEGSLLAGGIDADEGSALESQRIPSRTTTERPA